MIAQLFDLIRFKMKNNIRLALLCTHLLTVVWKGMGNADTSAFKIHIGTTVIHTWSCRSDATVGSLITLSATDSLWYLKA